VRSSAARRQKSERGAQARPEVPREIAVIKILAAAGIGGTLPTLCRLAASYSVGSDPPSGVGVYIALGLFFVIGMAVAFGFGESELKKAFVLGIAGPAVVTSTFNGASQGKTLTAMSSRPAVSGGRYAVHLDSLGSLIGIGDANAQSATATPLSQASSLASGEHSQLHITTNLAGRDAGYVVTPLELRFLSDAGAALGSTIVDPRVASAVRVPPGARTLEASIGGKTVATKLPEKGFESANLNFAIETSHVSDFLWALGSNRGVRIEGLSASLGKLVQTTQSSASRAAPQAGMRRPESLSAGSEVYSESGVPLGVVESVKPADAANRSQIVIRPAQVPPE
jgi:hypothetical protein